MSVTLSTTAPFSDRNRFPLEMLEANGVDFRLHLLNQKLIEEELIGMVADVEVIFAETEAIIFIVVEKASNLKHISGDAVGLDNVDPLAAEKRGIKVFRTSAAKQGF